MNILVKARHMDVTDAIKEYIDTKATKLQRYYDKISTIEVILDVEADKTLVESIGSAKRKNVFVGKHRGDDMYGCIDQCLHKVGEQLRRHKDRVRGHKGSSHNKALEISEQE